MNWYDNWHIYLRNQHYQKRCDNTQVPNPNRQNPARACVSLLADAFSETSWRISWRQWCNFCNSRVWITTDKDILKNYEYRTLIKGIHLLHWSLTLPRKFILTGKLSFHIALKLEGNNNPTTREKNEKPRAENSWFWNRKDKPEAPNWYLTTHFSQLRQLFGLGSNEVGFGST